MVFKEKNIVAVSFFSNCAIHPYPYFALNICEITQLYQSFINCVNMVI